MNYPRTLLFLAGLILLVLDALEITVPRCKLQSAGLCLCFLAEMLR